MYTTLAPQEQAALEVIQASRIGRSAGVLLHPTSLPGPYGIGDLGPAAYAFVEGLASARLQWWQVLPLGPTGFGDSPYQCFSAFAGNPYLVSPEFLVRDGLVRNEDVTNHRFAEGWVDYGPVIQFKQALLARAWDNFRAGMGAALRTEFEQFCFEQSAWLDDYALFMALKDAHGGKDWFNWEAGLVLRDPEALERARRDLSESVGRHQFSQFLFFRQWSQLRQYARSKNVRMIGDVPIFVSIDSADVWSNPDLFQLDERRRPTVVAGVPPDYFSSTGQLWGNPLYDWDTLRQTEYSWWVSRLKTTLACVDIVRLDHFRGFEAYWEVPAGMPTAEIGRWVKAPGVELFKKLHKELGGLPLIAEDLGLITPEVGELRERFELPGMRILHFAFNGDPADRYLPHNYEPNTVVYTGTHDNDTTQGWFHTLPPREAHFVRRYCPNVERDAAWEMLRLAWSSIANLALVPVQDLLRLGSEARMNVPGRPAGNWCWRLHPEQLNRSLLDQLAEMTDIYGRS